MTHSELVEAVAVARAAWESAAEAEQSEYVAAGYSSTASRAERAATWDALVTLERAEERARIAEGIEVPVQPWPHPRPAVVNPVDEFEGYDPAVERKYRVCLGYDA